MKDPKKDNWLYRLYGGDFLWGHFKYEVLKKIFIGSIIVGAVLQALLSGLSETAKHVFFLVYLTVIFTYICSLFYSERLSSLLFIEGSTASDAKWTLIWLAVTAMLGLIITGHQLTKPFLG
jgi:hypothetical protein